MNVSTDTETMSRADELISLINDSRIHDLYNKYRNNPKIKWKESIKKVAVVPLLQKKGLNV